VEPGPAEIVDVRLHLAAGAKGRLQVTLEADGIESKSAEPAPQDWAWARDLASQWQSGSDVDTSDLSEALGRCLLPGAIAEELGRLKKRSRHRRMRLWIEAADPSLLMLPWEGAQALHDEHASGMLAGHPRLSVVRRAPGRRAEHPHPPVADRLRVRVAAGSRVLENGDQRLEPLEDLVASLCEEAPRLDFRLENDVESATLGDLLADAHVLCFNGHAIKENDERFLLVHDSDGSVARIGVGKVNNLLKGASDLRVVILDACGSGELFTDHAGWSQIQADVLIAWQRAMTSASAAAFSRGFFHELARSGDLDEAVRVGREKLGPATGDSLAPVVFCRYPGGTISLAPTPPAPVDGPEAGARRRRTAARRGDDQSKPLERRPLVRWQPSDPTPADLGSWLTSSFREAARIAYENPRYITPYIGPGVLQTDPTSEEVRWDAGLAAAMDADADLAAFVRPLLTDPLSGRLNGRTLVLHDPIGPVEESVSRLRIAMARLAEHATATFVTAELAAAVPLNLWERHSVSIAEGDSLMERLDDARAALAAHQAIDTGDRLLGTARLQTRLAHLRAHLLSVGGGLSGASVAWLTDLFWHTIVFDSPLYPHVSELSLQVSLLAGQLHQPTRSLDPATVVARAELGEMSAATARSVARGYDPHEPADRPRRQLHRAIADVLHADYERWCRLPMAPRSTVVPFALTTGFDLEMERGLAAHGKPYEVAIPIYTRLEDLDASEEERPSESVCWIVGRFDACTDPTLSDLVHPVASWRLAASLKMDPASDDRPAGPLLIKLNGSPSHVLPEDPAALGFTAAKRGAPTPTPKADGHPDGFGSAPGSPASRRVLSIEHAVSLGEYDFLQVTRMAQYSFHRVEAEPNDPSDQKLPDGLPESLVAQVIRPERFWMLLGHRFSDWNTRAQVHTFIAHESRNIDRGCAVARSFDTDRLLFLDWLGITRASGEMQDLIDPLERAARDLRTKG
jgi:hypothetical protein